MSSNIAVTLMYQYLMKQISFIGRAKHTLGPGQSGLFQGLLASFSFAFKYSFKRDASICLCLSTLSVKYALVVIGRVSTD